MPRRWPASTAGGRRRRAWRPPTARRSSPGQRDGADGDGRPCGRVGRRRPRGPTRRRAVSDRRRAPSGGGACVHLRRREPERARRRHGRRRPSTGGTTRRRTATVPANGDATRRRRRRRRSTPSRDRRSVVSPTSRRRPSAARRSTRGDVVELDRPSARRPARRATSPRTSRRSPTATTVAAPVDVDADRPAQADVDAARRSTDGRRRRRSDESPTTDPATESPTIASRRPPSTMPPPTAVVDARRSDRRAGAPSDVARADRCAGPTRPMVADRGAGRRTTTRRRRDRRSTTPVDAAVRRRRRCRATGHARAASLGRKPRVRRVTRVVRHVDPWSVFKIAIVFNLVLYVVVLDGRRAAVERGLRHRHGRQRRALLRVVRLVDVRVQRRRDLPQRLDRRAVRRHRPHRPGRARWPRCST